MNNINKELYDRLVFLGIIPNEVRAKNIGASNYSEHTIQPYSIWIDWDLNPWDADIIKRVLRTKQGDSRKMDYEKIIHICQERIRQLKLKTINEQEIEYKAGDILRCMKSWFFDDGFSMIEGFTEGFNYNVHKDGYLMTNQGGTIRPTNEFLDKYFKKI